MTEAKREWKPLKQNYVLKKWYRHANHQRFAYPDDVDEELVPMLDVFNNLPGVRTEYCCCGHGYSGWYVTFKCTSDFMLNVIRNYFSNALEDLDEDIQRLSLRCKYEVTDPKLTDSCDCIPEKCIAVYGNELGLLPNPERKKEYMRICEFFSKFMPRYSWKKVHVFGYEK